MSNGSGLSRAARKPLTQAHSTGCRPCANGGRGINLRGETDCKGPGEQVQVRDCSCEGCKMQHSVGCKMPHPYGCQWGFLQVAPIRQACKWAFYKEKYECCLGPARMRHSR